MNQCLVFIVLQYFEKVIKKKTFKFQSTHAEMYRYYVQQYFGKNDCCNYRVSMIIVKLGRKAVTTRCWYCSGTNDNVFIFTEVHFKS